MVTTSEEHTTPNIPSSRDRRRNAVPLPVIAWLRLARVFLKIDRRTADTMRPWSLSVARFDILNQAGAREGRSQQELADALLMTKGNVTQLLDAMEKEGLLYREKRGRTNHVYLTDRGREVRQQSVREQESRIVDEFATLTEEEQATLLYLLRKLERSLSDPS